MIDLLFRRKKKEEELENLEEELENDDEPDLELEEPEPPKKGGKNRVAEEKADETTVLSKNKNTKCILINMVPLDWGKNIVYKRVSKLVNQTLFKRFFFLLLLPILIGSAFGGVFFFDAMEYEKTMGFNADNNRKIQEYDTVTQNLGVYNMYTLIPNNPSVYSQWLGFTYLSSRNGFLANEVNFTRNLASVPGQLLDRDGFALETGRAIQNIQSVGVWTATGMLSPRITNRSTHDWSAGFRKQAEILFGRYGLSSYVRVATGRTPSDLTLVMILWKQ